MEKKLNSLLIVVKEDQLTKGIALGLMDHFQSIHTTKNPYEAIEIVKNNKIEAVITDLSFSTIEPKSYIDKIMTSSKTLSSLIILSDEQFDLSLSEYNGDVIIKIK